MNTPTDKPTKLCDLVMKGGVTSGVVYPRAVCELAKTYNFKNIGGTSAGAIAAAAAAAAEYGRRHGSANGFDALAELPDWIGQPGRLVNMFRPEKKTRTLFNVVMAALNAKTTPGKILAVIGQLVVRFPFTVISLALAVWAIASWFLKDVTGAVFVYTFFATVLFAIFVFLVVVLCFIYRQITYTLPSNFYGMSLGYDASTRDKDTEGPLTNWLTGYLNDLAGKPLDEGPLTFGDLYNSAHAPGDPELDGPNYKAINLEMMTTALNHGRPYRLPFRAPDCMFYFAPEELKKLFPPRVIEHMIKNAGPARENLAPHATGCKEIYPFPEAQNLPVIVATRMSLSFPGLLGAVPLYAIDHTLKENSDHNSSRRAERCWFSDGGISSNLPIHFFDSPLPRWPTFAINLTQFHPDHQNEEDAVWLPTNADSGWQVRWTRFEKPGMFGLLSDFLWAILDTMQNWQDNAQTRVPAYRDRLVHVSMHDSEGGLNLNMPSKVIGRLADRGKRAGDILVERFDNPKDDGWLEHRWVRFRSCMDVTQDWLEGLLEVYANPVSPDRPLEEILLRLPDAPPSPYRLRHPDEQRAKTAMEELQELGRKWKVDGTGFRSDPPRPSAELRVKPRI